MITERGKPNTVVSKNGTQLASDAVLTWADQSRVAWHYLARGKPLQNAFIESFRYRQPSLMQGIQQHFGYWPGAFMDIAC
ncbi:hypothetical protein XI05_08780 [Bradyrhizobium sp. CCBAU 11357]|nr:hypothetical protein [Bradyrhizobium sp. CCBAU 11357]